MIKSQITLKQLEAFVFVVDTGTFRAAAFALGTTQPNISARISALEAMLKTPLFVRDAGSVHLTERGKILLDKAREVLWASEAFLENAGRQDLIDERLRLGVTELVACTWLREFLRLLKDAYPKLRVQLEVDISSEIDARLIEGQLDLAFQTEPFQTNTFQRDALGLEPYCWVAKPELYGFGQSPVSLAALFEHTILTHAKHTQAGRALHQVAAEEGLNSGKIAHSSALSACIPMVQEGLGVALLPKRLVRAEIQSGELVIINSEWLPAPLSFYARYSESRSARFVGHVAQLAGHAMRP